MVDRQRRVRWRNAYIRAQNAHGLYQRVCSRRLSGFGTEICAKAPRSASVRLHVPRFLRFEQEHTAVPLNTKTREHWHFIVGDTFHRKSTPTPNTSRSAWCWSQNLQCLYIAVT